jgi:RNA-binding protein
MITSKIKRRIRSELSTEKPTIWIGKDGASQQILNEISRQLEKREMAKIKILKTALEGEETKNIAAKIAEKTGSTLIDVKGHTIILYKPRKRKMKSLYKSLHSLLREKLSKGKKTTCQHLMMFLPQIWSKN